MYRRCLRLMDVRNASFVRWVNEKAGENAGFVVQELVRGVPVWIGCDGQEVTFGWLSALNGDEADAKLLSAGLATQVARYRPRLFRLHAHVRQLFPDVRIVKVFGDLFGGEYPHRSVAPCMGCAPVRKGVYYAPDYGFYAYDIFVGLSKNAAAGNSVVSEYGSEDGGDNRQRCLSLPVCNRLFESLGIFHARTLFQGRLEECLRFPNCFPTHLPDWLNLPPLRNNWCAGTVIRPLTSLYTPTGELVLLKDANSRLTSLEPPDQNDAADTPLSPTARPCATAVSLECADMLAELRKLFGPDILTRALEATGSHLTHPHTSQISGWLRREVLEQFFQLNLNRFDALPARERQHITRTLCALSDRLVRQALNQDTEKNVERKPPIPP